VVVVDVDVRVVVDVVLVADVVVVVVAADVVVARRAPLVSRAAGLRGRGRWLRGGLRRRLGAGLRSGALVRA
jgi:hypothetical protein